MAKVNVIIPAFNAAKYLPAAIKSVLAQTFDDWEICLVDDGSTDNTVEVIAPFLESHGSKIRYIRQENRGLPAARNAAIKAASGELLALLDADDIWLPCRLSESVKVMDERPQAGLSYGRITVIDQDDQLGWTWEGNPRFAEGWIAPQIYMRTINLPCPTLTFRRRCVDEVGLFDETFRATEDRDLWLRIALQHEVAFVNEVIAYYRYSPNQMSTDPDRMLQAQLKFIRKHYGKPGCGFIARRVAIARAYKQRAETLKAKGRAWDSLASGLRALVTYPLDLDNVRTVGSLAINAVKSPR